MAIVHAERASTARRPAQRSDEEPVPAPTGVPTGALHRPSSPIAMRALQQSAGNAAVVALMSNPPIVQRDAAIHLDQGTTDELQSELVRLRGERDRAGGGGEAYAQPIKRVELLLAERRDPGTAFTPAVLGFDGRTLSLFGPASVSYPAVSGRPLADGSFDYSPDRQRQEGIGPIPSGTYWLDPDQMTDLRWHLLVSGSAWGTHRITIHPESKTSTFGRGGFFIHGGSTPGSAGCIDLTSNDAAFAEALAKNVVSGSRIRLTVSYPTPAPDASPTGPDRLA